MRQALLLVLVSVAAALATHQWHPRAPALHLIEEPLRDDEVSMTAIGERFKNDVLWIDARPQEQFDAEHVPGALLLNEQKFDDQLVQHLDTLQTNQKPVVVYCSGQKCEASRKVMEKLKEMGFVREAFVLKGGWNAWKAALRSDL
ncbi:MAG: rhodanese-like domain-containing protein [Verrucomicrobiaceae bacterium]|nr:rhodanese-like domain-containing protein [Verrucomicrobiaceae bacterium]